jgi:putative oxidoreductase
MIRFLNKLQPWGVLLIRLALGLSMSVHGYEKVVPHGALLQFVHYVTTLHMPYWLGYVSAWTEFAGGILLILGLLTRFAAFMVAINMYVALVTVGIHQGFGIYNYIFALASIATMLIFCGSGALSLDRRFGIS